MNKNHIPNISGHSVEVKNSGGFSDKTQEMEKQDLSNYSIKKVEIKDVKAGDYVLSLNEETGEIEPHRINGLLDMGIKPTFNLTTEDSRSIRTTAEHPYLTEKGWLKVSELEVSDNIAVPVEGYNEESESSISLGETTFAFEVNNPLSPEKTGQLEANDNAIYRASLSCGANCFALDKNSENPSAGINVISLIKNSYTSLNSCSENLVNLSAFDLCFLTSSSKNSGAINSNLFNMEFIENTEETTPPHIKEEITTFASTTNLLDIFYTDNSSYLLARDELTSLANSSACFSVSCDFETICLNRTSLESLSNNILFTSIDKSKLGIALNSDFNSLGILILISSINNKDNLDYLKLSNAESVSFVVVPEENEGNCFVLFVDNKFKDKTFENVNSSFSSEFMPEGFVMQGVEEDLVNFFVNNFSEQRISFGCLINSFLTDRHEIRGINHFSDSRNFIEALCPIGISFNALFNSSICSFLGVNSSTGCQSICSQNSQSSSVTSRVCLNFSDMSCFINLITAPTNNLESNFKFSSGELINSINNKDNLDYLKLSKELPARCRSQIDKLLMQNLKFDVMIDYELINEKNLVNTI